MSLAADATFGPYEIVGPLGGAGWERCTGLRSVSARSVALPYKWFGAGFHFSDYGGGLNRSMQHQLI